MAGDHVMQRTGRFKSTLVPGKRKTDMVVLYEAGIDDNRSYRAEKTMDEDSDDTQDMELREWKKQGVPYREQLRRLQERAVQEHRDAHARLEAGKRGARNFAEFLAMPDESELESDEEEVVERPQKGFVIPALPKHLIDRTTTSPAAGRPKMTGLACSTPKNSDLSMGSLRTLDISHVVSTEQLELGGVTVHETNVVIPAADEETLQKTHTIQKEDNSLQKTFVKETDQPESSLQKTFVKEPEEAGSLQKTFVKETDQPESSLQKTFVKDSEESNSLQNTFVKETEGTFVKEPSADVSIPVVENTIEGGRPKRGKKLSLAEREKRIADVTSSLMSTVSHTPSPGASFFRNTRKKIRPAVAPTPPGPLTRRAVGRLSTESDKEKTIEMMSVDTFVGADSAGSSYIDPVSVNVTEDGDETTTGDNKGSIEPSSSSQCADTELHKTLESANFREMPAEEVVRGSLAVVHEVDETPVAEDIEPVAEVVETPKSARKSAMSMRVLELPPLAESPVAECSQRSTHEVNEDLDELTVVEPIEPTDPIVDSPPAPPIDPPTPVVQKRSTRRGVALLSDSIATVNTPGIAGPSSARRRPTDDTAVDEWHSDDDDADETVVPRRSGRNARKDKGGLQLAKRKLIEPQSTSGGVRRSSRVRVKPLRSWLGEQAVYVNSPSGGKRLKGVTDVVVRDRRLCKYRTADLKLAAEREQREKARKRERAAEKRRRLALDHSRGHRLNESQEDIVTSDEEEEGH